jgi:hypothetical protein
VEKREGEPVGEEPECEETGESECDDVVSVCK